MIKRIYKHFYSRFRASVKNVYYDLLYLSNYILSLLFNDENVIKRAITGKVAVGSKDILCVFAHYDKHGKVDDYVVYYLRQLYDIGAEIIFVTTSKDFKESEVQKIKGICSQIIIRENVGIDFGSWKAGLSRAGDTSRYKKIIIANDSVYGPFFDISKIMNEMEHKQADIWGITDSWEHNYHIQSYFLVFNSSVIANNFFEDFWHKKVRYFISKRLIIRLYELGISSLAIKAGFNISAYCNYREVVNFALKRYRKLPFKEALSERPLNPSHYLWKPLIRNFSCPFLKVELMRSNPVHMPDLYEAERIIKTAGSQYDVSLVISHLKRVQGG